MTTNSTTQHPDATAIGSRTVPSRALAAVGAGFALNGLALGPQWLFDGAERFSETAALWQYGAYHQIALIVLIAYALLLPTLAALPGRPRGLSPALLRAVTATTMLKIASVFAMAFIAPFLAEVAPDALDIEDGGLFMVSMILADVLFLVATVTLGVAAFRRRTFPRPAALLLALGGLVTPVFGPFGAVLLGTGLVWTGLSARRSGSEAAVRAVG